MENQQAHEPESEPAYQAPTYTPCSDPPKSSGFGRVMSDAKDAAGRGKKRSAETRAKISAAVRGKNDRQKHVQS